MKPKIAITREPPTTFDGCLSDHPLKKYLNIGQARSQHEIYCQTLMDHGIEIIRLPREDKYPDSCFVEDTAILHGKKAFICRMAHESRRGEEEAIIDTLEGDYEIFKATEPAIIEGGDVVHFDNKLLCGITKRTNEEGARQLREFLPIQVETFHLPEIMHLKSYVNYLGNNVIIVSEYYANQPIFENYQKIIIPKTETYATNAIAINNTILMAQNYPKSVKLVQEAGYEVITIHVSEITKCDGALTCLSIIF
ncbi:MAG: N(G),N(G)-dimethylarginine dimethylaminohydrolase [Asgard group archaeon]|nr:N(G),N(G)-dimethylarginine dimethylaminohydrolase [Asgard group archaeon]